MTDAYGTSAPIYSQEIGLARAEIYQSEGKYELFIVGDNLASFLGSSVSLDECIEEIRSLQRVADCFANGIGGFAEHDQGIKV